MSSDQSQPAKAQPQGWQDWQAEWWQAWGQQFGQEWPPAQQQASSWGATGIAEQLSDGRVLRSGGEPAKAQGGQAAGGEPAKAASKPAATRWPSPSSQRPAQAAPWRQHQPMPAPPKTSQSGAAHSWDPWTEQSMPKALVFYIVVHLHV